jgi:hypothetical protein
MMRGRPWLSGIFTIALILIGSFAAGAQGANEPPAPIKLVIKSEFEPAFDWAKTQCNSDDVPDEALRAFRRRDNSIMAYAANHSNNFMTGGGLLALQKDCRQAYISHHLEDPAAYDDETWVMSPWTSDGRHVMAIAHHEYHAELHPGRCLGRSPRQCRYGVLLHLVSNDGGATFVKSTPTPLAAVSVRAAPDQGRDIGFFSPSNIFERDGFEYVYVRTSGGGPQRPATCLMRSNNPIDPKSWRIYDGKRFVPSMFDPYVDAPDDRKPCAQISTLNGLVWSVLTFRDTGVLVALLIVDDPATHRARLATATSRDALHWSSPLYVDGFDVAWGERCPNSPELTYPSLLDPKSKRRNFDDTGTDALLFVTALTVQSCRVTMQRDLRVAHVELVPVN